MNSLPPFLHDCFIGERCYGATGDGWTVICDDFLFSGPTPAAQVPQLLFPAVLRHLRRARWRDGELVIETAEASYSIPDARQATLPGAHSLSDVLASAAVDGVQNLLECLRLVCECAVPSHPELPWLSCVRIRIADGFLEISATDGSRMGRFRTECETQEGVSVCAAVNAARLRAALELIRSEGWVVVEVRSEEVMLRTATPGRVYTIVAPREQVEYPDLSRILSGEPEGVALVDWSENPQCPTGHYD